jgi:hypothetical protein
MPHKVACTYLISRHKDERTLIDPETVNVSTQADKRDVLYEFSIFTDLSFTILNEA